MYTYFITFVIYRIWSERHIDKLLQKLESDMKIGSIEGLLKLLLVSNFFNYCLLFIRYLLS